MQGESRQKSLLVYRCYQCSLSIILLNLIKSDVFLVLFIQFTAFMDRFSRSWILKTYFLRFKRNSVRKIFFIAYRTNKFLKIKCNRKQQNCAPMKSSPQLNWNWNEEMNRTQWITVYINRQEQNAKEKERRSKAMISNRTLCIC